MNRSVPTSTLIFDQVALYAVDGVTRVTSAAFSGFTLKVFLNGAVQSWTIAAGAGVQNAQISAGTVYFQEISGAPGFYSVRMFLPAPGFWTFSLRYNPVVQESVLSYDARSSSSDCGSSGITASFT